MKIKILRNIKKDWAKPVEKELKSFLISHGFSIVSKSADITICMGGDGTILYFNHKQIIEGSILAIGGDKSQLCQLTKENWKNKILDFLKRRKTEERLILIAKLGKKEYSSLNDVVLHTSDYRVIETTARIGKLDRTFEGDGLIISTPTGSTAYAYSAGGIILDKGITAIEVVPICPYKRAFSPVIVQDDKVISMYADRTADFIIDGIFIKKLKPKEKIIVRKGHYVRFLV